MVAERRTIDDVLDEVGRLGGKVEAFNGPRDGRVLCFVAPARHRWAGPMLKLMYLRLEGPKDKIQESVDRIMRWLGRGIEAWPPPQVSRVVAFQRELGYLQRQVEDILGGRFLICGFVGVKPVWLLVSPARRQWASLGSPVHVILAGRPGSRDFRRAVAELRDIVYGRLEPCDSFDGDYERILREILDDLHIEDISSDVI